MSTARIVVDVWSGEGSMEHVARFLPTAELAWGIAQREINAGFLINLRSEVNWGGMTPFDDRVDVQAAEGLLQ